MERRVCAVRDPRRVPDPVRLMHRDSTHGYTDNPALAMPREPEAVPYATQTQITARAHRVAREAEADEWRERRAAVAREIDWLYSQRKRRSIRSEMRALARQLERLDALIGES